MDVNHRVVIRIPLKELWDQQGVLPLQKGRILTSGEVMEKLFCKSARFVIADVAHPLQWVDSPPHLFCSEIEARIVERHATETGFCLESFPGAYAYIASEWLTEQATPVVLLEKYH